MEIGAMLCSAASPEHWLSLSHTFYVRDVGKALKRI